MYQPICFVKIYIYRKETPNDIIQCPSFRLHTYVCMKSAGSKIVLLSPFLIHICIYVYMGMPSVEGRLFLFFYKNFIVPREDMTFFIIYGTDVGLFIRCQFDHIS